MPIQIDKAIFLHVPKTGGTWIKSYIRNSGMPYEEFGRVHMHCGELKVVTDFFRPQDKLIFCFVRHPLTWYRSYWKCKQQLVPDRGGGYLDTIVDLPFCDFLEDILQTHPGYLTEFYKGYTNCSHFVGKQESLRRDLNIFLKYLRIPYNKSYLYEKDVMNASYPEQKYTRKLAFAIMESENSLVEKYNYKYLPSDIIE